MSVKYHVIPRRNPINPEAPQKYYPSILRQIARQISKASTVNRTDTIAVLEALLDIIPEELSRGNIVDLGVFGSFWLRTKTGGNEDPALVGKGEFKAIRPAFRPGKEFQQALNVIELEKISPNGNGTGNGGEPA
jgi:nucleoid DNA-binding protein